MSAVPNRAPKSGFAAEAQRKASPVLWDVANPAYKNRNARKEKWDEIAEIHFQNKIASADLSNKWKNLRVQFRMYYAKSITTKSGQAVSKPVTWKYFDKLKFIQAAEEEQTNASESNLDLHTESLNATETTNNDPGSKQEAHQSLQDTPRTSTKRKTRRDSDETMISAKKLALDGLQKALTSLNENTHQKFCNYVASELDRIQLDYGAATANRLQRKLNTFFIKCVDEVENATINSKYSDELAQECLEWIREITGEDINVSGDMDNFYETLKDGTLLCKLVNQIKPGTIKRVNESKMAFKCMENINGFLEAAKAFGVPVQETFQTVDLWERQNLNSVVICLQSLGRKGSNFGVPCIGPKEADKNVRHFSEDQLRAGQAIISLQYGSNKGANQSGINFGNTRHIKKINWIKYNNKKKIQNTKTISRF
uniref:CSON004582 protein n=1 Tax=Culicoides sonorensis TaxID=179676 RepID=A0A336LWQ9_CULSO